MIDQLDRPIRMRWLICLGVVVAIFFIAQLAATLTLLFT